MRTASAAALAAVTLVVAACAEEPQQHAARIAVERASEHVGRPGTTRCTANPRVWFVEGATASVFLCAVRTGGASCDRYLVRRHGDRYAVRLRQRATDCILPAG
jgi:hypothetical protein